MQTNKGALTLLSADPFLSREFIHRVGLFHAWSHHYLLAFLKSAEISEGSRQLCATHLQPDDGFTTR